MLYIFTLSLCLANLYNSFSPFLVSNLAYKLSYARPFTIATAFALLFFVYLFSIFISYFVPCFLCLFLFSYALLNFLISPLCLLVFFSFPKCHSQYSFSCFSISASQNPGHLLSKHFLTVCLLQFPPSYLWLYFLWFFLFHHKSHFAYHHHTVLLCNTLIHNYLTITLSFRFLLLHIT